MSTRSPQATQNRGIMQLTTAQHMMGRLRKIKGTVVSHNSVTVVIVVDNVEDFIQMPAKTIPLMDLLVADVVNANHWIKMCIAGAEYARTQGQIRQVMTKKQGIHSLENSKDTDNQSELYFDQLEINTLGTDGNTEGTKALVQLKFQSPRCTNQLICQLDTGAEGNVIPLTTYKTMSPHFNVTRYGIPTNLHPSNTRITAYGGHIVTHYGTCKLQVTHRNESVMSTFHVVKSNEGFRCKRLPTGRALTLITLNYDMDIGPTAERDTDTIAAVSTYTTRPKGDETAKARILNEYADVFDGIGCFEGEYNITLDSTMPPVMHSPRRVHVALREPLKEELDTLIHQFTIANVDRPTDWVNSCVCVTKPNGKL